MIIRFQATNVRPNFADNSACFMAQAPLAFGVDANR